MPLTLVKLQIYRFGLTLLQTQEPKLFSLHEWLLCFRLSGYSPLTALIPIIFSLVLYRPSVSGAFDLCAWWVVCSFLIKSPAEFWLRFMSCLPKQRKKRPILSGPDPRLHFHFWSLGPNRNYRQGGVN